MIIHFKTKEEKWVDRWNKMVTKGMFREHKVFTFWPKKIGKGKYVMLGYVMQKVVPYGDRVYDSHDSRWLVDTTGRSITQGYKFIYEDAAGWEN